MTEDELAREFMDFRSRLLGIAYRMLGSAWDAEDVVADAMVRWMAVDRQQVREPLAFLTTVVTRLALDQLRSARVQRNTYVGEWLPEPMATEPSPLGPLDTVERREALSLATLRMMEALTPAERAVLVLHEAFDLPHAEIAEVLDITVDAARQHLVAPGRASPARGSASALSPRPTTRCSSVSSAPSREASSTSCRMCWRRTSWPTATAAARPGPPGGRSSAPTGSLSSSARCAGTSP